MDNLQIVILGAGNVAFHLSKALIEANHQIIQIYSRTNNSAEILAKQHSTAFTSNLQMLSNNADLYIITVSDDAISKILEQYDFINKNVVHTAGCVPISVFEPELKNYGVIYPLQTFSKSRDVNFREIPICIEANNNQFESLLLELAGEISDSVWKIDSPQRLQLHLSAVFANNFVNHLYFIAKDIISESGIDFKILYPLINETAKKAMQLGPKLAQTGPALRNDSESLKKHLELLSSMPEYRAVYNALTKDIYMKHNKI